MIQNFIPLFPHANQLDLGVDYLNQRINDLDRSIPDAAYNYQLAIEYLAKNRFNTNNFKSIRGELNVLFNWAWFVCGTSIAEIDRIALRKLIDFCNQPPTHLIARTSHPFFITEQQTTLLQANPKWQPFIHRGLGKYIRKTSTLKAQLSLLSSFFLFLNDVEYHDKNPAAILLRRLNVNNTHVADPEEGEKALSALKWRSVWDEVNRLANKQPASQRNTNAAVCCSPYSTYFIPECPK